MGDLELGCATLDDNKQRKCLMGFGGIVVICVIIFAVAMGSYAHLGPDDQVVIKTSKGWKVINGPTSGQLNPFQSKEWRKATLLDPLQYAIVQDRLSAELRVELGPQLLFLSGRDELKGVQQKLVLERDEYVRLTDRKTGHERVARGPGTIVPGPTELSPEGVQNSVFLNTNSAVVVRNKSTGMRTLVTACNYPTGVYAPAPLEEIVEVRSLIHVLPHEAMIVRDVSGRMTVYSGAEDVQNQEGQCQTDQTQGAGGAAFFLPPYSKIVRMSWSKYGNQGDDEEITTSPGSGAGSGQPVPVYGYYHSANRDHKYTTDDNADTDGWGNPDIAFRAYAGPVDGAVPIYEYYHEGMTDHEYTTRMTPEQGWREGGIAFYAFDNQREGTVPIYEYYHDVDKDHEYTTRATPYSSGWRRTSDENIAFYAFRPTVRRRLQAVTPSSSGLYVDQQTASLYSGPKRKVVTIDLRTQKSFYSYEVRTSDNVKLLLEGTIFWKILDVRKMLNMTSDPEGDVWSHSRSVLIGSISNVTLDVFMSSTDDIVQRAFATHTQDQFYIQRGITLVSMELTKYSPVDAQTAATLQEIIRETTKRINNLQKQKSDNEVRKEKLSAEIRMEGNRTTLIETQALNTRLLAETAGATDGGKVANSIGAFIDGLNETITNATDRMELFKHHKLLQSSQVDAKQLSMGNASLYVAPQNMSLRLSMPGTLEL